MGRSLTDASAQEGARLVALAYLDQAAAAAARLRDQSDAECLHDFRVSMRRLRACLRSYRPVLGDGLGKKQRKRLGEVVAETGAGRDAEVQLEWVRKKAGDAPDQRPGVEWIASRLERTKTKAYEQARDEVVKGFAKLEPKVREELSSYTVRHVVGQPAPVERFVDVAGAAMLEQLEVLLKDLRAVAGIEDEALAHDARIHGKRLRYLIEPLRDEVPDGKALVKELKALQDLLGDLNDLHNLARGVGEALEQTALERAKRLRDAAGDGGEAVEAALEGDERPGLLALLKRVQEDRRALFHGLMNEWLADGGRLDRLADAVRRLVDAMTGSVGERDDAEERDGRDDDDGDDAAEGERDDVEIERKYLLRALPPRCREVDGVDIDQGYLPGEKLVERVRRKRNGAGHEKYVRTVKHGEGAKRLELEEECDHETFSTLWSLTPGRRVRKRRYTIDAGDGLEWEIDEFKDRELFLAEIELPREDCEVAFPDWLAPYVEKDVTDDASFTNWKLAR